MGGGPDGPMGPMGPNMPPVMNGSLIWLHWYPSKFARQSQLNCFNFATCKGDGLDGMKNSPANGGPGTPREDGPGIGDYGLSYGQDNVNVSDLFSSYTERNSRFDRLKIWGTWEFSDQIQLVLKKLREELCARATLCNL